MASHHEEEDPRYWGVEAGIVTRNDDPLMLGRIKTQIPGIHDETEWIFPMWGGSAQRGLYHVPKVKADVNVWFHRGDPHGHARYTPGNWGMPGGASEAPTFISADSSVTPQTAAMITGIEDDRYYFAIDSRPGKEKLSFVDKVYGDTIMLDGHLLRGLIKVTGTLTLQGGQVLINGGRVLINGRSVVPFGGPIG